jgi:hypothetical protein
VAIRQLAAIGRLQLQAFFADGNDGVVPAQLVMGAVMPIGPPPAPAESASAGVDIRKGAASKPDIVRVFMTNSSSSRS